MFSAIANLLQSGTCKICTFSVLINFVKTIQIIINYDTCIIAYTTSFNQNHIKQRRGPWRATNDKMKYICQSFLKCVIKYLKWEIKTSLIIHTLMI